MFPRRKNSEVFMKFVFLTLLCAPLSVAQPVWLDELDLSAMQIGWGSPHPRLSVEGHSLSVAGQKFERGVGTHAVSTFLLHLNGKGDRFSASVGVDDEVGSDKASVSFAVLGDGRVLWESHVMKKGISPQKADVDLHGVNLLGLLVTDAGDGIDYDHADWCDARIDLAEQASPRELVMKGGSAPYVLTPKAAEKPRINGARVFGVRPGHPFLYKIAATGKRPISFSAKNLPEGLTLDSQTGMITGALHDRGVFKATLGARNDLGEAQRDFRIFVGDSIALTPPMGWNSWNCWACAVDDQKVRASADAMLNSGLADHGWTYVNIDDCWEVKPGSDDSLLRGEARSAGMINTNKKFPDMKALSDYVHSKGLKLGIYSGPGPLTCAGFTASYQFENQDAERYASWGIDYLKYDWCSYDRIASDRSLPELKKPYAVMRKALDGVDRDIVFSLCQYGMGNVWEWGAEVGGNSWRTTGDIEDSWSSMSHIGFGQAGHEVFAGPGHWNDPDMLVVGLVGWGPELHPSRLTPDEQYTHISLWSLLSAPLLIGCDLSKLDDFTLNLLTNDEVIDISQDPLGRQASRISDADGVQVWSKDLEDGSKAVGIFWADVREKKSLSDYFDWEAKKSRVVSLDGARLGFKGKFKVRDVWRQRDRAVSEKFSGEVPYHGVLLLRCSQE